MVEWGMLSHPQNKESLPWTLGPSPRVTVERSPSWQRTPGGHPCESEDPGTLIPLFLSLNAPLK